jgi:hypothetical protein
MLGKLVAKQVLALDSIYYCHQLSQTIMSSNASAASSTTVATRLKYGGHTFSSSGSLCHQAGLRDAPPRVPTGGPRDASSVESASSSPTPVILGRSSLSSAKRFAPAVCIDDNGDTSPTRPTLAGVTPAMQGKSSFGGAIGFQCSRQSAES